MLFNNMAYQPVKSGGSQILNAYEANSVILSGVSIGKDCILEARSVLTKNIPDYVFWGNSTKITQ